MTDSPDKKAAGEKGPNTIMVIDPNILVRMAVAEYLRECGYKVIEGVAAEDVFAVLQAGGSFAIVLTEVQLPGPLDGFGLARQIRETYPEIDVILVTGIQNTAYRAGDLCEEGPLEAPYHPQELVRRINVLRERRRSWENPS